MLNLAIDTFVLLVLLKLLGKTEITWLQGWFLSIGTSLFAVVVAFDLVHRVGLLGYVGAAAATAILLGCLLALLFSMHPVRAYGVAAAFLAVHMVVGFALWQTIGPSGRLVLPMGPSRTLQSREPRPMPRSFYDTLPPEAQENFVPVDDEDWEPSSMR